MKSDIQKFTKIVEIMSELYESDQKYFIDCFFDMYYQMKKKITVTERCYGDNDLISRVWSALNLFQYLVNEKNEPVEKSFTIAYRKYNIDSELFKRLLNSFKAFKSAKKTRFKDL